MSARRYARNKRVLAVAALAPPAVMLLSSCELGGEEVGFNCGDAKVTQSLDSRTPGWVQAGGAAHLDVKGSWFEGLELPGKVSKVVLSMPVPPTIAEIKQVTFTGGTFTGTSSVQGGTIRMELTAKGGDPDLPSIGIDGTVKAGAVNQVRWPLYDKVEITAGGGGDDDHGGGGDHDHGHGVQAAAAPGSERGAVCTIDTKGYVVNFSRVGTDPGAEPATTAPAPPTTDAHGHTGADHDHLRAPATTTPPTTKAPAPTTPPTTKAPAPVTTAAPAPKVVAGPVVTHMFGPVQVQVTITGNRITDVTALQSPTGDDMSKDINGRALPILRQQVIDAQSADIAGTSIATYTTKAYKQSLQAALDQAGFKK